MSQAKAALALALLATMGGMSFEPRKAKRRKQPRVYADADQAELDRLYLDRSSPGRKAYKAFKRTLTPLDETDLCPECESHNIANEGPESELTCHDCSNQWEPQNETD